MNKRRDVSFLPTEGGAFDIPSNVFDLKLLMMYLHFRLLLLK